MTRAVGKRSCERGDGLDLGFTGEHATLELEVVEAVALARRLGQPDDRSRRHRFLVADAEPVVVGARILDIRQFGPAPVADEEQVAQHLDRVALLAFAEQCRHRHVEVLAEQIEQRRFDGRHRVDRRPQIEGLQAAPAGIAIGKALAHLAQERL